MQLLFMNYRRSKSCDDEKYSHATERKSNFVGDKECMVIHHFYFLYNH